MTKSRHRLLLNDHQILALRSLIEKGQTQAQASLWLANELGRPIHRASVFDLCKKHGIRCQRRGPRSGPGHTHSWRGGQIVDKSGYVLVYAPDHPDCLAANELRSQLTAKDGKRRRKRSYVRQHRLVMEQKIGRHLLPSEVVHHLNGDRADNRPENLGLFQSNRDHLAETLKGKRPKWTPGGYARMGNWKKAPVDAPHREDRQPCATHQA